MRAALLNRPHCRLANCIGRYLPIRSQRHRCDRCGDIVDAAFQPIDAGPQAKWVTEPEFAARMSRVREMPKPDFVTGPGRSGAVAAVYASYALGVPFVPWGIIAGKRALIVDTASMSGKTMRRARRRYEDYGATVDTFVAFDEREQRHHFWFEEMAR